IAEVKEEILKLNPDILVTETTFGAIDDHYLQLDLRDYHWAASEEAVINATNRPKTFSISFEQSVPKDAFESFLKEILPQCFRIKGFALLDDCWYQVDVVTDRIDYKPCSPKEESCMVMISRVSIQLLKTINNAWKTCVGLPVKLHN
ncbi:MAG: GTP-binding protein, partial [Firmicutes bacterium]|nr:GTP-binding protein [Bacillota bacterium]